MSGAVIKDDKISYKVASEQEPKRKRGVSRYMEVI